MFWTCLDWRSLVEKSFERGLSKKEVSGHPEKFEMVKSTFTKIDFQEMYVAPLYVFETILGSD